jgi:hypothetical protein
MNSSKWVREYPPDYQLLFTKYDWEECEDNQVGFEGVEEIEWGHTDMPNP